MFAIDIFPLTDTKSFSVERFFYGQPVLLIGASEGCQLRHPLLESLPFEIMVRKLAGSNFECQQIFTEGADLTQTKGFCDQYESLAKLNLGTVKILINSIDVDLLIKEDEAPDDAGYRLLKQAITSQIDQLPALAITKPWKAVVSFNKEQSLTLGRAEYHQLVINQSDISSDHARFGYSNNRYWVEDLGSTNGTFINRQQVSGKTFFEPGEPVLLGGSTVITGLTAEMLASFIDPPEKIEELIDPSSNKSSEQIIHEQEVQQVPSTPESMPIIDPDPLFPTLLAVSKVARPGKLILKREHSILIGRDSESDLWLGAPYVSRVHNILTLQEDGSIKIEDRSSNGTAYSAGMIPPGGELILASNAAEVLHYGSGLAVAICFNAEHEEAFIATGGRADTFISESEKSQVVINQALAQQPLKKHSIAKQRGKLQQGNALQRFINKFLILDLKSKIFICCFVLVLIAFVILLISLVLSFL